MKHLKKFKQFEAIGFKVPNDNRDEEKGYRKKVGFISIEDAEEKVLELMKKLKEMSERGEEGERDVAKTKLEKLSKKYGISINTLGKVKSLGYLNNRDYEEVTKQADIYLEGRMFPRSIVTTLTRYEGRDAIAIPFTDEEMKVINIVKEKIFYGMNFTTNGNNNDMDTIKEEGQFNIEPDDKTKTVYNCFVVKKVDNGFIKERYTMMKIYDDMYEGKFHKYFLYETNSIIEFFEKWYEGE